MLEAVLIRLGSNANPKRPLDLTEVADGLTSCFHNAVALLADAELLAAHQRPHRALALTILALEELGKVPLLAFVPLAGMALALRLRQAAVLRDVA
jgi:hypothetical protein